MIKVETLVYEYEQCTDCPHAGFNIWDSRKNEDVWGCDLQDKKLYYTHLMERIPKWCPLPTKE